VPKIATLDEVAVRRAKQISRDRRGSIIELVGDVDQTMRRLILVTSKKGSARGNHFHLRSGHFVYILEGNLRLTVRAERKVRRYKLAPGTIVWIPPLVDHAFYSLIDSKALEYANTAYSPDDASPLKEPLPAKR